LAVSNDAREIPSQQLGILPALIDPERGSPTRHGYLIDNRSRATLTSTYQPTNPQTHKPTNLLP
jgi:hypothetical protein